MRNEIPGEDNLSAQSLGGRFTKLGEALGSKVVEQLVELVERRKLVHDLRREINTQHEP